MASKLPGVPGDDFSADGVPAKEATAAKTPAGKSSAEAFSASDDADVAREQSLGALRNQHSVPPRNGRWAAYRMLLLARMKELWREPEVIFWVFVFPLLLAFGLGIAFRDKPADTARVAVIDAAGAQRLAGTLNGATGEARVHAEVLGEAAARNGFRLGRYDLVITPLPSGAVEYDFDPARPDSVLARHIVDDVVQSAAGRRNAVATVPRPSSEAGARYIDFLIPGLLGMNLMNSGMWGIGFALVEMRQRKLLKRYLATPMRKLDFLLALTSSRLVLMLIELALLLGFGCLVFHMRVMGSYAAILLVSTLGAVSFAGIGLLTASRAQKIESVSGLINLVMMPMWIFSGVFFSYARFPAVAQPLIRALPLTALNDALRATILEGAPLYTQWAPIAVLAVWGGLSFALALRWFRWN